MSKAKNILVLNTPVKNQAVNRDMAGGLGYKVSASVVLPPIDMLLVAMGLKKQGRSVFLIDGVAERLDFDQIKRFIEENEIKIVIASLSLPCLTEDIVWFRRLVGLGLKVVVKTGISYPEILRRVMKETKVDKIVYGEPELSMEKIMKSKKKIINGGWVADLDDLPIPYRKWLKTDLYGYGLLPGRITTMQISRGCPFKCGFYCPYPLVQGKQWRAMSVGRVIREMKQIKKLKIDNILFRDATFTLDQKRTIELCGAMIKNNFGFNWWCETRANVLNEETLKWMKKAGCRGINLGVETMDENRIYTEGKPGVSLDQIRLIRDKAKKLGIKLHFLMIVGLPDETVEGLHQTFKRLLELRPESVGFSLITPYPGTELFKLLRKEKLLRVFDWNKFDGSNVVARGRFLSVFELRLARWLMMATSWALRKKSKWTTIIIDLIFRGWLLVKKFY